MIQSKVARAAVVVAIVATCVFLTLHLTSEKVAPIRPNANTNPLLLEEDVGTGLLAHVRRNGYVLNLAKMDLNKLTDDELLMTIHSYPDNTDALCRRKFRMGKIADGGWEICDDPDIRPRPPCIIYSFGINYDFSFDDDASKLYGCHVYSFDPSMDKVEQQFNRSEFIHFYKIGLDGRTYTNEKKWPLYTLSDIRKLLGHEKTPIDVIKMDIENSEWPSVPQMIEAGELDNVRQLLMEYHVDKYARDYLLPRLKVMQAIEKAGFKKFYVNKNYACAINVNGYPIARTGCYEVHYLKR